MSFPTPSPYSLTGNLLAAGKIDPYFLLAFGRRHRFTLCSYFKRESTKRTAQAVAAPLLTVTSVQLAVASAHYSN